jgi:branched-chain amino acid transport system substrate-binding protein
LRQIHRFVAVVAVAGLLAAACSESEPESAPTTAVQPTATDASDDTGSATTDTTDDTDDTSDATETTATSAPTSDGSVIGQFAGEQWFRGTAPSGATPADDSLEPVVIGMINQENSPIGSFPELRAAAEAAVAFINAELGGVNGRPLQLVTCITAFSLEESQACAQRLVQAGATVVMSGIDVSAAGSVPVLEQNGVPLVGGIPTTLAEMQSPGAFFFSGGVAGALVAFAAHAADQGNETITIAFGEFDSFEVPARDYGAPVAESLGLEVQLLPFALLTTDFLPVLTRVIESNPDAVVVGAADSACVPVINTLADLGYQGQLYLVGACAADQILEQVADDRQAAVIFNSEGPVDAGIEGDLYQDAVDRYATAPAGGGGTVTFRATMNVWAMLSDLGADVTPAAAAESLRSSRATASFWGHPYTCDGNQIPGLPALCAPQQTLMKILRDGDDPTFVVDDWIDVPALVAGS